MRLDIKESFTMEKLSEIEKSFAENNHNLVYKFLHTYGYNIEEHYSVAVLGYLKSVQVILSILVDTFISKISLTMQPGPKIDSISGA